MNPAVLLALINGALSLLEMLLPELAKMGGLISVEQQQKIKERVDKIRSGEAFTGDPWKQD